MFPLCLALLAMAFPVRFGPEMRVPAAGEIDKLLRAPFPEGTAHPPGTKNCLELLAWRGKEGGGSGPDFLAAQSTRAECLVYQTLKGAAAAKVSHLADLAWDENVMKLLPAELAITVSTEKTTEAAGKRWVDFDGTAKASGKGPNRIRVAGDGFVETLILWGRGDFNRDGVEDLLVQTQDALTEGTYRATRLYVLTRKTADGPLTVARQLL